MSEADVSLALTVPIHTDAGVLQFAKIETWRFTPDGSLAPRVDHYILPLSARETGATLCNEQEFNRVLAEAM